MVFTREVLNVEVLAAVEDSEEVAVSVEVEDLEVVGDSVVEVV